MKPLGQTVEVGPYRGRLAAPFLDPSLLGALARLPELLQAAEAPRRARRSLVACVEVPCADRVLALAVKSFSAHGLVRSWRYRRAGSKAARSWRAAMALHRHGAGTPQPVGFLERWVGPRLVESYYLSVYESGLLEFRQALIRMYRDEPVSYPLMQLLQAVADGVRAMHQAGVQHRDLGNQNILLRRTGPDQWDDVRFVDLNRARVLPRVDLRLCARDISRIHLPSDLLRIFKEMYFGARPSALFERWERRYRSAYALHSRTRRYRHPFRARPRAEPDTIYPDARDIWIWDDRSAQAVNVVRHKERRRLYPWRNKLRVVASAARALPAVYPEYRRLLRTAFAASVDLAARVGVALDPPRGREDREAELLQQLGPVPVLLRFYHHAGSGQWGRMAALAERLAGEGHVVAAALVQDRQAVNQPERWDAFMEQVVGRLHPILDWVEIGHAVNRVKWGIWDFREHRRLFRQVPEIQRRYPDLKLMGPAGIDFEYAHILPLLNALPPGVTLGALSHHLYVDRRGAPENRQGPFGPLEKFALARAVARWCPHCDDRLVVSEVNWPLRGAGDYSPVNSPYDTPGPRANDPSVSEEDYACFLVRYLALALCSGLVDRVYWWRLVSRGFGLVDDTDSQAWRPRPAFSALRHFLHVVGNSRFEERMAVPPGTYALAFRREDGERVVMAWAHPEDTDWRPAPPPAGVEDLNGQPTAAGAAIRLTASPVYLRGLGGSGDVGPV